MSSLIIIIFIALAALIMFVSVWVYSFVRYPIHSTLRFCLSLFPLLILGGLFSPNLSGQVDVNIKLGSWLSLGPNHLDIVTGAEQLSFRTVFIALTLLVALCIFRLEVHTTR
jgi:uncharacterized membrane protein YjdF